MEAAVRWSPQSSVASRRFLITDVSANRLQLCQAKSRKRPKDEPETPESRALEALKEPIELKDGRVQYKVVAQRENLPNFTAFDWSREDENLVAIGTSNGETRLLSLTAGDHGENDHSFPVRSQRKCNSVAFNRTHLLATGLDRIRGNDSSLNVYDLKSQTQGSSRFEPYRKLTSGGAEVITNVKFFRDQPQTLIAGSLGIARHAGGQNIKIFDLREDSSGSVAPTILTKQVHLLSIDTMDENYFASACPVEGYIISVWDRRAIRSTSALGVRETVSNAVLNITPVVDSSRGSSIWSLRFSGYQRGVFAVLSSGGQVKLFETAKYTASHQPGSKRSGPQWPIHFVKKSTHLEYPSYDQLSHTSELERAIAFDFATPGHLLKSPCLLSIRQDRTLQPIQLPLKPILQDVSSSSEMVLVRRNVRHVLSSGGKEGSVADDLLSAQIQLVDALTGASNSNGVERKSSLYSSSTIQAQNMDSQIDFSRLSSLQRHENLHFPRLSGLKLPIELAMMIQDTARRRCFEGYLFDCARNKKIIRDNIWLVELWEIVERLERMAANGRMTYHALDFSFLGVHAIWTGKFLSMQSGGQRRVNTSRHDCANAIATILERHGYNDFTSSVEVAAETEYPSLRQICLAICGWKFSEQALRAKCSEILARRDYYKAIIVAVCHERRDIAIEYLKTLSQTRTLENAGSLAALIAVEKLTDAQRDTCEWSAEEADDIYLRALLRFFILGDWKTVVEMAELPLPYRVAIALKYLSDADLDVFLSTATDDAIRNGDSEGIVLTGLAQTAAVDLFGNYITRFNDLQSAVLALAFVCPAYIKDSRFNAWKELYYDQMQAWRAFMERTKFTTRHTRMTASRGHAGSGLVEPPPSQTTLRCRHCQAHIARKFHKQEPSFFPSSDDDNASTTTGTNSTSFKPSRRSHGHDRSYNTAPDAAHSCPYCHRKLARCCLCLRWQGGPVLPVSRTANDSLAKEAKGDLLVGFIGWCRSCKHGNHAKCARDWFSPPDTTGVKECAVPGCSCTCYVG